MQSVDFTRDKMLSVKKNNENAAKKISMCLAE